MAKCERQQASDVCSALLHKSQQQTSSKQPSRNSDTSKRRATQAVRCKVVGLLESASNLVRVSCGSPAESCVVESNDSIFGGSHF
eukprot:4393915-Amphidinium_carterae.1